MGGLRLLERDREERRGCVFEKGDKRLWSLIDGATVMLGFLKLERLLGFVLIELKRQPLPGLNKVSSDQFGFVSKNARADLT